MNASTPPLGAASRRSVVLLAFASALMLTVAANADTSLLVDDTFTNGFNADTTTYPRWSSSSPALSYTSPSENLAITANGSAGTVNLLSARVFDQTTLTAGQTLTLSYNFTSNSIATTSIYRCGLYNLSDSTQATVTDNSLLAGATAKAGYYSFFDNNGTAGGNAAVLRRENITSSVNTVESSGSGTITLLASTATTADIGTTTRSVVFSVSLGSGGATTITSTLYSGAGGYINGNTALYSLTQTETTGALTTFDSLFLLTPAGTIVTYDNIQVALTTAIPEPGTTATCIGGFGLITALILRRKRLAAR